MTRTPEFIKQGWRQHGPGQCKCPSCGAIVSTNALARANHAYEPNSDRHSADRQQGQPARLNEEKS